MPQANQEIIQHGSREMNFAVYDRPFPAPDSSFSAHWHHELEINYVYAGPVDFLVDGVTHTVPTGDMIFINRNLIHACQSPTAYAGRYVSIVFGEQFVFSTYGDALYNLYLAPLSEEKRAFPTRLPANLSCRKEILSHVREALESCFARRRGYEMSVRAHLLAMYQMAVEHDIFLREGKPENATSHLVRNALLLIQQQYTTPLSVTGIAADLGVTPEYLCRIFKAAVGKSPLACILSCRLEHAQFLLTQTDAPISDIAVSCGFDDFNYFSRFFKKAQGLSPPPTAPSIKMPIPPAARRPESYQAVGNSRLNAVNAQTQTP